jgi:peptidoglycan hydrolase-like protein with peptidoglycan-binding domain
VRYGASGSTVKLIQQRLKALGYDPGPVNGIFGSETLSAVKAFQASHHLTPDGVVGPATWKSLFASQVGKSTSRTGYSSSTTSGSHNTGNNPLSGKWTALRGLEDINVAALAVGNGKLYVADSWGGRVYDSQGHALTGMTGMETNALLDVNGIIYAATTNSVLWAPDTGGDWQVLGQLPNAEPYTSGISIGALLWANGRLYAGAAEQSDNTPYNRVYVYANGTWQPVGSNYPAGETCQSLVELNGTIYAGTSNGVYAYSNGSWKLVGSSPYLSGHKGDYSNWVSSLTTDGKVLYAATQYGVFKYQSGSWHALGSSQQFKNWVNAILVVNGVVYAGTEDGVYAYQSGRWVSLGTLNSPVAALAELNGILYAGTQVGLYTWQPS